MGTAMRWGASLLVAALVLLFAAIPFWPIASRLLGLQLGAYAFVAVGAGLVEAIRRRDWGVAYGFPAALATMHISWGFSLLWGLISAVFHGHHSNS